jgi:hypothetical protein
MQISSLISLKLLCKATSTGRQAASPHHRLARTLCNRIDELFEDKKMLICMIDYDRATELATSIGMLQAYLDTQRLKNKIRH